MGRQTTPNRSYIVSVASCVFIIGLSTALAQPSSPAPGTDQTGVIEGTVVSATTNEPVERARVLAVPEGAPPRAYPLSPVIADASGHFVMTGLSPGRYRMEAHADHFVTKSYGSQEPWAPGMMVPIAAGQHISDVNFRIFPCGVIAGTVRDENGRRISGAKVRVLPFRDRSGFPSAPTDRRGEYRISDIDPGTYLLEASYPQPGSSEKPHLLVGGAALIEQPPDTSESSKRPAPQKVYLCMYYPNTTDPGTASSIAVQPGSVLSNMDFELPKAQTVRVRGRLMNGLTGKPTPSGLVGLNLRLNNALLQLGGAATLAIALDSNISVEVKDPSGSFELRNVPAGSYWVDGQISDNDKTLLGHVPIEVSDADVDGIIVTARDDFELKGQVRVESGAPFEFSHLNISLEEAESPLPELLARPKADGSFAFPSLTPATYRLKVKNLPLGFYLKSGRIGGSDILDAGVNLDSGNSGPLEIALGSPGGTVSGEVRDNDQPASATVYLGPEPTHLRRLDLYFSKPTNGDGTFTLTGIPPGNYRIFALRDADLNLTFSPAIFQRYEVKGESVGVDDGSSQSVQLELISVPDE